MSSSGCLGEGLYSIRCSLFVFVLFLNEKQTGMNKGAYVLLTILPSL